MKLFAKTLLATLLLAAPVAQAQVLGGRPVGGVVGGVVGSTGGAISGAVGGAGAISGVGGLTGAGQGTGMFGATFGHGGIGSTARSVSSNLEGVGGGRAWGTFEEPPRNNRSETSLRERFSRVSDGVALGRAVTIGEAATSVATPRSGQAKANGDTRAARPKASLGAHSGQSANRQGASSSKNAQASAETRRVRANASGEAQLQASR